MTDESGSYARVPPQENANINFSHYACYSNKQIALSTVTKLSLNVYGLEKHCLLHVNRNSF